MTLEPTPLPGSIPHDLSGVGSNHSPARRLAAFRRPGDPGRVVPARDFWAEAQAGSGKGNRSRPPFDRLQWWTVRHQLVHRLAPYRASDVSLMFRQATWGTILYWSQLLDGIEIEEPVSV